MTFGEKLKKYRTERGMSQESLASILGTSKQVISRYETGQRSPKIVDVIGYTEKLDLPSSYFMDNSITSVVEASNQLVLSEGEQLLLELFRQVPADQQRIVLDMIRVAISNL
jgi:transcriptional regulator with XRE-family HTH domain